MGIIRPIEIFVAYIAILGISIYYVRRVYQKRISNIWDIEVPDIVRKERADALERSRSIIRGQVSENLAPFMKEFKYQSSDARFLGSPIDYLIFDGMSAEGEITIILADVKTGKAKLTQRQRKIRDAIKNDRIKFEVIRIEPD